MNYTVEITCECGVVVSRLVYRGEDLLVAETALHEAEGHPTAPPIVPPFRVAKLQAEIDQLKTDATARARAMREKIAQILDERAKMRDDLRRTREGETP